LVLAFLQVSQLLPVVEIAARRSAAAEHFGDLTTPGGWDFNDTFTKFLTLLMPGTLNTRTKWWVKVSIGVSTATHFAAPARELCLTRIRAHQARLFRLILTQSTEGYWDASSTVAFAVLARTATEVAELKSTWLDRLKERLADVADLAEDVLSDGFGSAVRDRGGEQDLGQQRSLASHKSMARSNSTVAAAVMQEVSDDPLVCFPGAIAAAMPRRLAALLDADADLDLERVWCTLIVIAVLETLNISWLWGDGDVYPQEERTIVDAGREWVEGYAAQHPALHAALADGAVATAASRTVAQWHRAWDARVSELRRVDAITEHHGRSHIHRTCCELMRAFTTKHATVRACFAPCPALRCAAHAALAVCAARHSRRTAAPASLPRSCRRPWMACSAGKCLWCGLCCCAVLDAVCERWFAPHLAPAVHLARACGTADSCHHRDLAAARQQCAPPQLPACFTLSFR
jgi:hypothetical protein